MTDPIKDSADQALRWMEEEAVMQAAYADAFRWLTQAAAGKVPTNKETPMDTPATSPVDMLIGGGQ